MKVRMLEELVSRIDGKPALGPAEAAGAPGSEWAAPGPSVMVTASGAARHVTRRGTCTPKPAAAALIAPGDGPGPGDSTAVRGCPLAPFPAPHTAQLSGMLA